MIFGHQRITLYLLLAMGFASCKNPCSGVDCGNGDCREVDGEPVCICDTGYEGENCGIRSITKFLGNFNGTESCTSGSTTYAVEILEDPAAVDKVTIENLYSSTLVINATVLLDSITIGNQSFGNGTIEGGGSIASDGNLNLQFTVMAAGQADPCNLTLVRN